MVKSIIDNKLYSPTDKEINMHRTPAHHVSRISMYIINNKMLENIVQREFSQNADFIFKNMFIELRCPHLLNKVLRVTHCKSLPC